MRNLSRLLSGVLVLVCVQMMLVEGANKSDFYNLYYILFEKNNIYRKEVRPVENDADALDVYMDFDLMSLVEVDEKDQKLVVSASLNLLWTDEFLGWPPAYFGGIESFMVPQKMVWLPDIVLTNGITAQTRLGYNELPVRLRHNGQVRWEPSVLLATSCSIVITYFPFDTQHCDIEFETAVSSRYEVHILISEINHSPLDDFNVNGQWEFKMTSAQNVISINAKNKIKYTITLTRRRKFYLIYIFMPVFFLSLMTSLIFAMPADEGERMGTGITVVLSFTVYLTIVAGLVPNTSLQVSILGVYLTLLLGLSSLSLIVCVFILRLHFRDNTIRVGQKMRSTVCILRRITYMGSVAGSRNAVVPISRQDHGKLDQHKRMSNLPEPQVNSHSLHDDDFSWQIVAATLDWFCFILFSTLTVVATLACMLVLEIGSVASQPRNHNESTDFT